MKFVKSDFEKAEQMIGFLNSMGVAYKKGEHDHIYAECPYCHHHGKKFNVNITTGAWNCYHCLKVGGSYQFGVDFGFIEPKVKVTPISKAKDFKKPIFNVQKSIDEFDDIASTYVTIDRCLTFETSKFFRLGMAWRNQKRTISIPYFEAGELTNVKFRYIPPDDKDPRFDRTPNCRSTLFNVDNIDKSEPVFVCEAEFDAMSLWQLGKKNVVASSLGAKKGALPEEWLKWFEGVEKIYVVYDNDAAGLDAAFTTAKQLGFGRVYVVKLPCKDVNEFLSKGGKPEKMKELVREAERFDVGGTITSADAVKIFFEWMAFEDESYCSVDVGPLEKLIGAVRPGSVVTLCATKKTGKTSLATQLCLKNAEDGYPSLIVCKEEDAISFGGRLARLTMNVPMSLVTHGMKAQVLSKLDGKALYFSGVDHIDSADHALDIIESAACRYGLRLVVFDHVHLFEPDQVNEQHFYARLSKKLVGLARRAGIVLLVVVQPRNIDPTREHTRPHHMKGTGAWGQDATVNICLWRPEPKIGDQKDEAPVEVYVEGRGSPGGVDVAVFNGGIGRYRPALPGELSDFKKELGIK